MADVTGYQQPTDLGNLFFSNQRNEASVNNTNANTAYMAGPQTANTNADTQGKNIANAKNMLQLRFMQQMYGQQMNMPLWQPPDNQDDDTSGVANSKDEFMGQLVGKASKAYAPPVWDAQSQAMYNYYQKFDKIGAAVGVPSNMADTYKGQFDALKTNRQEAAGRDLDMWTQ